MTPYNPLSIKGILLACFAGVMIVLAIAYFFIKNDAQLDKARKELQSASPFKEGQMVESVVDERRGMVVAVICINVECRYRVRFAAQTERTNARWGADGDIQVRPYATVTMREFELRGVRQ